MSKQILDNTLYEGSRQVEIDFSIIPQDPIFDTWKNDTYPVKACELHLYHLLAEEGLVEKKNGVKNGAFQLNQDKMPFIIKPTNAHFKTNIITKSQTARGGVRDGNQEYVYFGKYRYQILHSPDEMSTDLQEVSLNSRKWVGGENKTENDISELLHKVNENSGNMSAITDAISKLTELQVTLLQKQPEPEKPTTRKKRTPAKADSAIKTTDSKETSNQTK